MTSFPMAYLRARSAGGAIMRRPSKSAPALSAKHLAASLALLALACVPSTVEPPRPEPRPDDHRHPLQEQPAGARLSHLRLTTDDGCVVEDRRRVVCWGTHFSNEATTSSALRSAHAVDLDQGGAKIVDLALAHGTVWAAFDDGKLRSARWRDGRIVTTVDELPVGVEQLRVGGSRREPVICTRAGSTLACGGWPSVEGIVDFDVLERGDLLFALHADGTVDGWDPRESPRSGYAYPEPIPGAVQLELGNAVCVRTGVGELYCNASVHAHARGLVDGFARLDVDVDQFEGRYEFWQVSRDEPVIDVEVGASHRCELREPGLVRCQGNNNFGQLGAGDSGLHRGAVDVELPGPTSGLATSETQTCALVDDAVYCWGALGLGYNPRFPGEVATHDLDASSLHIDGDHSCASLADGQLWCWGTALALALGQGDIVAASSPRPSFSARSPVDDYHVDLGDRALLLSRGELVWGRVLDDVEPPTSPPFWTRAKVASVDAANGHACLIRSSGTFECWARDLNDRVRRLAFPQPGAARAIDLGELGEVCVVESSGAVACAPLDAPEPRAWREVPGLSGITQLVHGRDDQRCALDKHARSSCWQGAAEGSGYVFDVVPFTLDVAGIVALAAGEFGVCALTSQGEVRCGRPSAGNARLEQTAIDAKAVEIDAGRGHWCARLDEDGDGLSERVVCQGDNRYGQLGVLGDHVSLEPTKIEAAPE